jgi:predicted transcriptional regulator
MSRFGIIPAVVFDADLTPQDIALLALLSTYANKEGYCYPSYETIADKLNRSKAWVSQRVSKLEAEGFLKISMRKGQKYGFTLVYDCVQPAKHSVQPSEQTVQPAEQNNTNNNKYTYRKARQIPDDFEPTLQMLAYLAKKRPDLDPKQFTENFIFSCKAKGYLYKNWLMAWQKWVINTKGDSQHGKRSFGHRKGSPTLKEIGGDFQEAIALAGRIKP